MKKIISFIVSAILFISAMSTVFAEKVGFEALIYPKEEISAPSDWAAESIGKAKALGITDENMEYDYTSPITRKQFCRLAVNMLELCVGEMDASKSEDSQNRLGDTNDESVQKLFNAGIVQGKHYTKSGVIFEPDASITREESATILYRMVRYMNLVMPQTVYNRNAEYYKDKNMISDFAVDAVFYMREMGIMTGTSETEFSPKDTYTTEQAIITMVRIYDVDNAQPDYSNISVPVFKITDKDGNIIITEKDLLQCNADYDSVTGANIAVTLSDDAQKTLKAATAKIAGYENGENYIEIIIDKQVISKPSINSEMDGKTLVFTCDYSIEDVIGFVNIVKSKIR